MNTGTRSSVRLKKGEVIDLQRLDALLDVPVEKWERHVARLARDMRTKGVQIDVPASRLQGGGPAVTWTGVYDAQVRNLPRMDRAEEFRMARRYDFLKVRVRDALLAAGYPAADVDALVLRPVHALPAPAKAASASAREHLERAITELQSLRNLYVEGALYLVHGPVRRYLGLGVDEVDLIQEGNASLFQAIEGFDWRRDVRFKTYALYWVQQAILKTLYNASRTVRIPIWVQKAYRKIRRAQEQGRDSTGMLPDSQAVAEELGMPAERVEDILGVRRFAVSLDANRSDDDDDGYSVGQSLADDSVLPVHESIREADLSEHLERAMEDLPERERIILMRRFGLGGREPETLADIAKDFGVTPERVRQLQKAALERLQKPQRLKHLKMFA